MKIEVKAILEIDTDFMYGDNQEGKDWFFKDVLVSGKDTKLILHSDDIGDEVSSTNNFEFKIIEP